jgi:hypothetical protein
MEFFTMRKDPPQISAAKNNAAFAPTFFVALFFKILHSLSFLNSTLTVIQPQGYSMPNVNYFFNSHCFQCQTLFQGFWLRSFYHTLFYSSTPINTL